MKAKRTIEGNYTANARIKIDYRGKGKAPLVKFSYPDIKNQMQGSMFSWIFILWISLLLVFIEGYSIGMDYYDMTNAMKNPYKVNAFGECVKHYTDNFNYVVATTCYNETSIDFRYKFNIGGGNFNRLGTSYVTREAATPLDVLFNLAVWLWIIFGVPMTIYLPFRKFWNGKVYPKWNATLSDKKYVYVKPKDVQRINGVYQFEIPLFHNVRL
jgi:hypothetical protein